MRRFSKKFCAFAFLLVLIVVALRYAGHPIELPTKLSARNATTTQASNDHRHKRTTIVAVAQLKGSSGFTQVTAANLSHAVEDRIRETGFNVVLSDQLSLERAVPDVRHKACRKLRYEMERLPAVSIILVSYNEQRSVLLRTIHSLINRTPAALLHELILVDDCSSLPLPNLHGYLSEKYTSKLHIVHSSERVGLIGARLLGARQATAKVLVFLDAHVEAAHDWLPPLLAPIVADAHTCTTPIIDTIKYDTFEYVPAAASRGGFNWQFNYVQLPLLPAEQAALPVPHPNPVMSGGLFAISADFFWHLGAYDESLSIWGAEQFELSFKIWMCGGRLLEIPCSRVGHLHRAPEFPVSYSKRSDDFISRNYKRIAEVWMDEYKEYLYEHIPKLNRIRAGDLSARKALRNRLECKTFQWYLHTIAPDLVKVYPPITPPDYASGAIQSLALPELCLDTLNKPARQVLAELQPCSVDLKYPYVSQRWRLGFRRNLQQHGDCLEVQAWTKNAPVWLWPCHNQGGNQFWYYDRQSKMLVHGSGAGNTERRCLDVDIITKRVFVNSCKFGRNTMKWHFGYVNHTAMNSFYKGAL